MARTTDRPPTRRPLATWIAVLVAASGHFTAWAERGVEESVRVSRVLVEVRALDREGVAIPDLGTADFELRVDGERFPVASVDWIDEVPRGADDRAGTGARAGKPAAEGGSGRLLVLLFQRDLEPWRIGGLMRLAPGIDELVGSLSPEDRVAVLVHQTRLELVADFTGDRDLLRALLAEEIVRYRPPEPTPASGPSLLRHLDAEEAGRASSPEWALLVLGRALREIPGTKSVLLFGWGLGRIRAGRTEMRPEWEDARRELIAARATVFSLDVTQADFHSLEGPLVTVAEETGGFYVKTYHFPALGLARLRHALSGHYVLTFEKPDLGPGRHRIRVRLAGRGGTVYAREFYED